MNTAGLTRPDVWREAYDLKRAREYDRLMPLMTLDHAAALEAVVDMMGRSASASLKIFELGAGTGLLTQRILERYPGAEVEGIDGSQEMLAMARRKLSSFNKRLTLRRSSFQEYNWDSLAAGAYHAVVSSFSLHHLDHGVVPGLFDRLARILAPGGRLIIADYVASPYPRLQRRYEDLWVEARRANLNKTFGLALTKEQVWKDHEAAKKAEGDNPALLDDLLKWLASAGLEEVECYWKNFCYAVYGGVKLGGFSIASTLET
ncbi:MAG: class I SAM-dependent methyltransferase [Elusimicrobiota bacterium]